MIAREDADSRRRTTMNSKRRRALKVAMALVLLAVFTIFPVVFIDIADVEAKASKELIWVVSAISWIGSAIGFAVVARRSGVPSHLVIATLMFSGANYLFSTTSTIPEFSCGLCGPEDALLNIIWMILFFGWPIMGLIFLLSLFIALAAYRLRSQERPVEGQESGALDVQQ
jgi:hypothetical protein